APRTRLRGVRAGGTRRDDATGRTRGRAPRGRGVAFARKQWKTEVAISRHSAARAAPRGGHRARPPRRGTARKKEESMSSTAVKSKSRTPKPRKDDFKVSDLSLAEFGRKEITIAESEMPGLMAIREEYRGKRPLAGAR